MRKEGRLPRLTFKAAPDIKEKVHIYMKEDSTVAETDKTWSSYIKRPAG